MKQVDAYRYNSASIRVRVIDPRFEGMSVPEASKTCVFPVIDKLPKRHAERISSCCSSWRRASSVAVNRHLLVNQEFEHPLPSVL